MIFSRRRIQFKKDLTIANLSQTESVQALKDGVVDAVFFNFAYPGSAVMDLAATRDIVLVPIDQQLADKILKKHPYYVKIVIPGKTYSKVDQDVPVSGRFQRDDRQQEDEG